ncbi:MAG: FxLYD domain-containing protein [Candidatus Paceibacterota bacterium]
MTPRLVKQLLYGAFYLLIIIVILWLVYVFFLKPAPTCFDKIKNQNEAGIDCGGPCPSCELAQLKNLSADWALALPARENEITLLAEIANPNLNFGAKSFSYQFKVIGPFGAVIKTVEGQSFIYAGEVKYLMETSIPVNPRDVKQVVLDISVSSIDWQLREEIAKPNLDNPSRQTAVSNGIVTVKGIIQNKSPLLISQAKIIAVLYDSQGNKILNASYTTLTDLKGSEQRAFSIGFPEGDWTKQLDANRTKIFIEPRP